MTKHALRYVPALTALLSIAALGGPGSAVGLRAQEPPPTLLWPDGAPGARGEEPGDQPTIWVHRAAAEKAVGTAVVICPGGGYANCMMSYEGHDVARWFNSVGVTAVVLRYRHAPNYRHPTPLLDVQRAIRWTRAHADELGIAPERVGVLGFSAGGHLAASAGTLFDAGRADAADRIDRVSSRPDFLVLAYPVITLLAPHAHMGSRHNLLGPDSSDATAREMSLETRVTKATPPTFLFHTSADQAVPSENSVLFYGALRAAGVEGELHIYREGPHGVGLDRHPAVREWPNALASWLRGLGLLDPYVDGRPRWVWLDDAEDGDDDRIYLRREFAVTGKLAKAEIVAACDNSLIVHVNGKRVLSSDSWETPVRADVRGLLVEGRNAIAVEARNAGGPAGFVARLELSYEGAKEPAAPIVSNRLWRGTRSPERGWNRLNFRPDEAWVPVREIAAIGAGTWGERVTAATLDAARAPTPVVSTPPEAIKTLEGFRVERLHSVPREEEGSWVNLCVDPKGRLIVSDQYGGLYRVTVPPVPATPGGTTAEVSIERIELDVGGAHGLVHAFGSLYAVRSEGGTRGLYRIRDTDGDDRFDQVELLRPLGGGGEHGPHAVVLSPDGKQLYIVGGNHTALPSPERSLVPRVWGEDVLLGRLWDATGHARGILAPGGWIARTDPDGKEWELVSTGYRNEFDIAFDHRGELFTYDADMEWDVGTDWYRPTRINHVTSGSEFGWRSGTGKWPEYYADSLGSVADIGPGSPTGITFGHGARFPEKYQRALFICDWSYGKMYAVHLEEDGATFRGVPEQFLAASPLPLSDVIINPHDGAMYFLIGGRRVQSGLYRVTHVGQHEAKEIREEPIAATHPRAIRRRLESLHGREAPGTVDLAWKHLGHPDRAVRFAARIAIEHQPVEKWRARVAAEENDLARVHAVIALARHGEEADRETAFRALLATPYESLDTPSRLALLRAYQLVAIRLGRPEDATREAIIAQLDRHFPTGSSALDRELSQLLLFLDAESAVKRSLDLLFGSATQEEQIGYALFLSFKARGWSGSPDGWKESTWRRYLEWFHSARGYFGGHSFQGFVRNIRDNALESLTAEEKEKLADALADRAVDSFAQLPKPEGPGKAWGLDELASAAANHLSGRDFERGKEMFSAAYCFQCHRFDGTGGATGPDLTGLGGRFSPRDVLEAIVDPNKVISDQYQATTFVLNDGRVVTGRIVNMGGDNWNVNTDMTKPGSTVGVRRDQVLQIVPSDTSMMPAGLLDRLNQDEVLDLLAYLLSRGDRKSSLFAK